MRWVVSPTSQLELQLLDEKKRGIMCNVNAILLNIVKIDEIILKQKIKRIIFLVVTN